MSLAYSNEHYISLSPDKKWSQQQHSAMALVLFCAQLLGTFAYGDPASQPNRFISQGQEVAVEERGFKIQPPIGWEVLRNYPGLSLLMQATLKKGMKYQRTLQVMSFQGPKKVGAHNADEIGKDLLASLNKARTGADKLRIRNFMPVTLKDSNQALLFYTELKLSGVALMQAHMVVSSSKNHYILSYTDLAEYFEDFEQDQGPLTVAWESMLTFAVDEIPASPLEPEVKAGLASFAVVLALLGLWYMRSRKSRAMLKYQRFSEGLEGEDHQTTSSSQHRGSLQSAIWKWSRSSTSRLRKASKSSAKDVDELFYDDRAG